MTWTCPLDKAPILLATLVLSVGVLMGAGCDSETDNAPSPPQPWRFESKIAPYAVDVPGEWQKTSSKEINQFADLALTVDERVAAGEPFRVIVIPQELPQYEGVASPDASAIKRASLGLLEKRVDGFEVQREGPLKLDGEPALTVFAEGMDKDEPVQYITAYATHGDFGYQIVAWGLRKQQEGLVQAFDKLLDGWRFTDTVQNSGSQAPPGTADEPDAAARRADDPQEP